ncbi:hypothetical protein [Microcoleus sp. FACHB-831]|uniref:NACHT C-terminal helical domain 2-containing protein n=1 Tax=Microcoleus sp. FACHB-831 TaxID=2692827 RepID=UPI001F558BB7|nr:hypothetical protein [Microcoleus sp. FACHB-831]
MQNVDDLIASMKQQTELIIANEAFQPFLRWLVQKSLSVKSTYKPVWLTRRYLADEINFKPAAIRAFYFALAMSHIGGLDVAIYRNFSSNFSRKVSRDETPDSRLASEFDLACALARDVAPYLHFVSDLALIEADDLAIDSALDSNLESALELAWDCTVKHYKLQEALRKLKAQLPDLLKDKENFEQWWQANGQAWTEQLRAVMIEHRNIGHDWQFSKEQKELLQKYYDANKLLVDCMNSSEVSDEVRQEIEDTLLLPISEIEKYKTNKLCG